MFRHIISVSLASLAMTACASLIPIKANAASITLVMPPGSNTLQKKPGDSLTFLILFEGAAFRFPADILGYSIDYDRTELSLIQIVNQVGLNQRLTEPRTILANYTFEVLESVVKDGEGDISATVNFREPPNFTLPERFESISTGPVYDIEPVPEPVPEPLTIFGTATALGCGALFKRKSSKKTVS
jgi:hypothetical protein